MDLAYIDMDFAHYETTRVNFRGALGMFWNYHCTWHIMKLPKVILGMDLAHYDTTITKSTFPQHFDVGKNRVIVL